MSTSTSSTASDVWIIRSLLVIQEKESAQRHSLVGDEGTARAQLLSNFYSHPGLIRILPSLNQDEYDGAGEEEEEENEGPAPGAGQLVPPRSTPHQAAELGLLKKEDLDVGRRQEELERDRQSAIRKAAELVERAHAQRQRRTVAEQVLTVAIREAHLGRQELELEEAEANLRLRQEQVQQRRLAEMAEQRRVRDEFLRHVAPGAELVQGQFRDPLIRGLYEKLLLQERAATRRLLMRERLWETHRAKVQEELNQERVRLQRQQHWVADEKIRLMALLKAKIGTSEVLVGKQRDRAFAATEIQAMWRGHVDRRRAALLRQKLRIANQAAARIQALARGFLTREMVDYWRPTWIARRQERMLRAALRETEASEARTRASLRAAEALLREELVSFHKKLWVRLCQQQQRKALEALEAQHRRTYVGVPQRKLWQFLVDEEKAQRGELVRRFAAAQVRSAILKLEALEVFSRSELGRDQAAA
eukprot:RCo033696